MEMDTVESEMEEITGANIQPNKAKSAVYGFRTRHFFHVRCQISRAYSRTVRSADTQPADAILHSPIRA